MAKGALTVQVARSLQEEFGGQGFDILYDHGKKGVDPKDLLGKIHSFYRDKDGLKKILGDLDIAVIPRGSKRILALVEIEENSCKPKTILGDVFATLLGSGILFHGSPEYKVWKGTTLIVMAFDAHHAHRSRTIYLDRKIKDLKTNLAAPNAKKIRKVKIDSYENADDLAKKLKDAVRIAIIPPKAE